MNKEMKNAEIIAALPQLKTLKAELRSLDAQIKMLERQHAGLINQRDQLDAEVDVLGGVTSVIDGVAVHAKPDESRYGKGYTITALGHDIPRSGEVYPNANTGKNGIPYSWGIHIRGVTSDGRDTFLGANWGFRDAVEVCRRWTVYGERPSKQHEELCFARHKLDPHDAATPRVRAAFEAAWMAGEKTVAESILKSRSRRSRRNLKRAQES